MQTPAPIRNVIVVDDDLRMREALAVVFTPAGLLGRRVPRRGVLSRRGAAEVAGRAAHRRASVPGLSGLSPLDRLDAARCGAPIVMISADADVAHAVTAVKAGAFDYMVKPLNGRDVVARIASAIAAFERRPDPARAARPIECEFPGQAALTSREREVLDAIAGGRPTRRSAARLRISPRTVEVHRARIMVKIGARNAADLVLIVLGGGYNGDDGHNGHAPPGMVA